MPPEPVSGGKFNPPPGWPVPPGFSPGPDWTPHPEWPPGPQGWSFWVDEFDESPRPAPETRRRRQLRLLPPSSTAMLAAGIGLTVIVLLVIGGVALPSLRGRLQPHLVKPTPTDLALPTELVVRPDWPPYSVQLYTDLTSWSAFGGVSRTFADNGHSVVLDTHDTIESWTTKWSGLISSKTTACAARIVGKVRDINHIDGVAGGFGIGLGALLPGDAATAELSGTAIQFDFGLRSYRSAAYPSDTSEALALARLDDHWHDVEVIIDASGQELVVDGNTVGRTPGGRQCGHPFIRVWAGAAEFADFTVSPLD